MKLHYIKAIILAAKKVGVSSTLLLSVCMTESNLSNATNTYDRNKGSHGICQVNGVHAKYISTLYDPETNAMIAARILKSDLDKYKDTWVAVSAYSTGSNKWYNAEYVNKVKHNYKMLNSKKGLVCLKKKDT